MSNSELETPILSIENVSKRFVKSLDLAGKMHRNWAQECVKR